MIRLCGLLGDGWGIPPTCRVRFSPRSVGFHNNNKNSHTQRRFPAKNAASDTTYQYHVRVFMTTAVSLGSGGFGFTTQPRAGFMTTAYRQRTELGFVARGLVLRQTVLRPSSPGKIYFGGCRDRTSPGFRLGRSASSCARAKCRENANNSFRTATVSKSGIRMGRRTAANAPAV